MKANPRSQPALLPSVSGGFETAATSNGHLEVRQYDGATASEMIAASLAGGIVAARHTAVSPEEAYAVYDWVYALVRKKRGRA